MRDTLTQAIEDYLRIIYDLSIVNERVSTSQIAKALDVRPASATGMIQKLAAADPPLVEYRKHYGVILTPEGEQIALEIIRHHRLLETFLHETLGFEWDAIHAEADRLEHVISEEFEERIAQRLGDPTHDPHGDPIPDRDLQMPSHATTSLNALRAPQQAIIERVRNDDPELLRYLSQRGIVPGARVTALDYSPFDDNLSLQVTGQPAPVVLGPRITHQIYIEIT